MNRVGIVTFFKNNNYGSVLQCYALQQVLKDLGVKPIALNQEERGLKWKLKKILRVLYLGFSIIKYPNRCRNVFQSALESKRSCAELAEQTRDKFNDFVEQNIIYKNQSFLELKECEEYSFFISGSDQVWGTSGYFLNPFMFLRFAEKRKRYAYAASFGADKCPRWYENTLKKYISEYERISVREQSGLDIVKKFGVDARIDVDPTMLLDVEQWRKISTTMHTKNCMFAYFLNEPSDIAIEHINNVIARDNIEQVIFAPYKFEIANKINSRVDYKSLSPNEFLGIVDAAKVVCTDSFHGAVFSIIFRKKFYSYYRQYTHNELQNNRIETLLKHFELQNQLIVDKNIFSIPDFTTVNLVLEKDKKHAVDYLKEIIEENI